jgi:hypothetical protein
LTKTKPHGANEKTRAASQKQIGLNYVSRFLWLRVEVKRESACGKTERGKPEGEQRENSDRARGALRG